MVVSGCVGPRGDGYDPGAVMSADEAQAYHAEQIGVFAEYRRRHGHGHHHDQRRTRRSASRARRKAAGMPVAISFTVETDGRLPTGQTPAARRSRRWTRRRSDGPAYYMINCAHPTHFDEHAGR